MSDTQKFKFEKILAHYREKYEINYQQELASMQLLAVAAYCNREDRTILGMKVKGKGPEACEYVLFYEEPVFDKAACERLVALVGAAEREYVRLGRDHAFSFISAVVFCGEIDAAALKDIRRLGLNKNYGSDGWVLGRFVLVPEQGALTANKDGTDLKKLLERVLADKNI